jgi:hypothetical protein
MGWTAYPGIDQVLKGLLSGSREILGSNLFGLYLFGSLASGGFDPDTSDIDFVAVTRLDCAGETAARLGELSRQLQQTGAPWAAKLEGSFLPARLFEEPDPDYGLYPTIGMGGWFGMDHKGIERPLQRFMLREHGIALAGPAPQSFIAPVGAEALKRETREVLHGWWRSQLDDPVRLRRRGYQAYAVLTMCRMLYTLDTGSVSSKPAAARWARPRVAEPWRGLIDRALVWRDDDGVDDFAETLELVSWMLREAAGSPLPAPPRR